MLDTGRLVEGAAALGVTLDDRQTGQFARYAEMLEAWNARFNLTRVPPGDYVPLHFLDSLTVCRVVDMGTVRALLDVGTGAGLPGVPLKIAYPHLCTVLLDSTRKRLAFLDAVVSELDLSDTTTLHARAEGAARSVEHRARYDCVAARAVARMEQLAAWLLPFAAPGGSVVALKSASSGEEVREALPAIRRLGGEVAEVAEVPLPTTDIVRSLVVLRRGTRRTRI